eukprot:CAMPEP_0174716754 /NCGR_PEP_ID=MMETSP1094-20130205/24636_1 /TAXON_ID=156173 /ORGANISM="Chrysochromulina brevifilum, Strain UTEX LB 985" /LENGTH=66 /DNA_ID=CAMNT_0015916575 /DNA_START=35 /DNA_END=235 /DNA_ORIENTATION=-
MFPSTAAGMSVMGPTMDQSFAGPLNPTDMDIDVEDTLGLDHETSGEKTDTDFFNEFEDDFDDEDLN